MLDISDVFVLLATLLFDVLPCRIFVDDVSDDEGFRLRPPLRDDVYGDLFFIIYSCAYKSTPISL